jgi:hypothetical protein
MITQPPRSNNEQKKPETQCPPLLQVFTRHDTFEHVTVCKQYLQDCRIKFHKHDSLLKIYFTRTRIGYFNYLKEIH